MSQNMKIKDEFVYEMRREIKLQMSFIHKRLDKIERSYHKYPNIPSYPRRKEEVSPMRDKTRLEILEEEFSNKLRNVIFDLDRKFRETQKCKKKEKIEGEGECERKEGSVERERVVEKENEVDSTVYENDEEIENQNESEDYGLVVEKEGDKQDEQKENGEEIENQNESENYGLVVEKEGDKQDEQKENDEEIGFTKFEGINLDTCYDDPFDIPRPSMTSSWYIKNLIIGHFIFTQWAEWMGIITSSIKFKVSQSSEWKFQKVLLREFILKALLKIRGRIFFKREGMIRIRLGKYHEVWKIFKVDFNGLSQTV